jgi:hypothetical protein
MSLAPHVSYRLSSSTASAQSNAAPIAPVKLRAIVTDHAPVFELAANFLNQAGKRMLVDVAHLSGARLGLGIDNLVASGNQRDARPLVHRNG